MWAPETLINILIGKPKAKRTFGNKRCKRGVYDNWYVDYGGFLSYDAM
jgi:hypothetical protein